MQTRVGIATGLVVVGDLIGSGASQERGIVGETPNLAARLQGIAEPNRSSLAKAPENCSAICSSLKTLGLRNSKALRRLFEPGHRCGRVRRRAASRLSTRAALPTSSDEKKRLELLLRRWSKAKSGEGQVVLLSGEPGIGKSRLTAALLERVAPEPHTRLRYFCSPQHTDSALSPIISQMERAAEFAHGDTAQTKLDKLDALLAQSFTHTKTPRCLPKCCRCGTMDVIRRSISSRSNADRRHSKR